MKWNNSVQNDEKTEEFSADLFKSVLEASPTVGPWRTVWKSPHCTISHKSHAPKIENWSMYRSISHVNNCDQLWCMLNPETLDDILTLRLKIGGRRTDTKFDLDYTNEDSEGWPTMKLF